MCARTVCNNCLQSPRCVQTGASHELIGRDDVWVEDESQHLTPCYSARAVARIFQRGVQYAEILLTIPTFF